MEKRSKVFGINCRQPKTRLPTCKSTARERLAQRGRLGLRVLPVQTEQQAQRGLLGQPDLRARLEEPLVLKALRACLEPRERLVLRVFRGTREPLGQRELPARLEPRGLRA